MSRTRQQFLYETLENYPFGAACRQSSPYEAFLYEKSATPKSEGVPEMNRGSSAVLRTVQRIILKLEAINFDRGFFMTDSLTDEVRRASLSNT